MKNLTLRTLLVILILTAFMMSNAVALAADSQTGTTKQKKKEEIPPPDGEKWYEEGDEELYKFDIHPVTPKKGITGGVLIYYGHFVEPPYKVELIPYVGEKHEKKYTKRLLINGLPVFLPPRFIARKFHEASRKKAMENYIKPTEEEIREFDEKRKLRKEISAIIEKEWNKLTKKYNPNTQEGQQKIKEGLESFLSSYKRLNKYHVTSYKQLFFCADELKVDILSGCNNIIFDTDKFLPPEKLAERKRRREEYMEKQWNDLKKNWEKRLSRVTNIIHSGFRKSIIESDLIQICSILRSKDSRLSKITRIFQVTDDLMMAKFIYYNLDCNLTVKELKEKR